MLPPARAWQVGEHPSAPSGSWLVVAVVSLQFPYFPFYGSRGWSPAKPAWSRCASAVLALKAWHGRHNTQPDSQEETSRDLTGLAQSPGEERDGPSCAHPDLQIKSLPPHSCQPSALALTPALCGWLLHPERGRRKVPYFMSEEARLLLG